MADPVNSFLNFDAGISRVVWDTPFRPGELPERRQLPPSEAASVHQLDRLLLPDNIDAVVARSLRPEVATAELLRPDRFADALKGAAKLVQAGVARAEGADRAALAGLNDLLREQTELTAALDYYRDMLIAG